MPGKAVSGTATVDFDRVAPNENELVLDAIGFDLKRVRLDTGRGAVDAKYHYDGDRITVSIPTTAKTGRLLISYRAKPRRGLYFLEPDQWVTERPVQVWSQCQDEDARHWFPCHDKPNVKMTTELRVKVPRGFVALSNGELVTSQTPKGTNRLWVYHFKMDQPHPSYLMTLVVGKFDILEDRAARNDNGGVPVVYLVPPGREDDGWRTFSETPRMIELFGKLTGVPYPWSRYSQVVVSDFIFGGMENTTATTMYEHILLDKRSAIDITSNDLIAHELAHQWFGDFVTCRDWSHGWLNEGFATFFEHVEREDRLGRDEYDYGIEGDLSSYLGEASSRYMRAIVCRDYEEPIDLFDRHLYEKGGLVLHMLRRELGDEVFWRGVNIYLKRHARGIVETNDLQRALEEASGLSLEQFFDQWVFRPGHPSLRVKISWADGLLSVQSKQTQKTGDVAVFAYELEIEVGLATGKTRRMKKRVTTANDTLVVSLQDRPTWVAFDPNMRVAANVAVEAPNDMLRTQLEKGSSPRTRWAAAQALAKRDDMRTIDALGRCLKKSSEKWMVRAEAATVLGRIGGDDAFTWLEKSAFTPHPKVRRAVAAALGNLRSEAAAKTLVKLARKDRSHVVQAAAARALGRTRQPLALKTLTSMLDQPSWADVKRAGVLDGLAALRDERAIEPVLERTRYGIPTRGRRAAIAALPRLTDSKRVREHLEDLLADDDPHLRIEVVKALEAMGAPEARIALRRQLARDLDGRVHRRIREALRDLTDRQATERRRTRDELEQVKNELGELKVRLAKIEGESGAKNGNDKNGKSAEPKRASRKKAAARGPRPKERKRPRRS